MAEHICDAGHFDRSICPEPCGMMHSYCSICDRMMDYCYWSTQDQFAPPKDDGMLELAAKVARVEKLVDYWARCGNSWRKAAARQFGDALRGDGE